MDYSEIRGFNYQPSYGSSALQVWQQFDPAVVDLELGRGKKHFPKINAIRLWLSWDAFIRDPKGFARSLDRALEIADRHGLRVMPVLFNRWHCPWLDLGGIYIDHFLPGVSWVQQEGLFEPYLDAIVGGHAADLRVLAWDLCNEPFSFDCPQSEFPDVVRAEYAWLEGLYTHSKQLGPQAPVTVSIHPLHGRQGIEQIEPVSDILAIHPYWTADSPPQEKSDYERLLDDYVAFSAEVKKPLLATETCWGALDDAKRGEIIRYTLAELEKRGIGWLAHLLHHSLVADAHRPEFGPVGYAGNMSFIQADGSLRPGHEAFNEF